MFQIVSISALRTTVDLENGLIRIAIYTSVLAFDRTVSVTCYQVKIIIITMFYEIRVLILIGYTNV